jgi:RNA polymerase sigma-70 factor (ECF subfamily)
MQQIILGDRMMQAEEASARLKQFVETESSALLASLRLYLSRAGLATGCTAAELLSEVVVEALQHANRFDPNRQPMAWLLGIAANLIKRKQAEVAKRNRREPLARDLFPDAQDFMSDDEIFEQFAAFAANPSQHLETNEQVALLLAGVPQSDQQVLRLAILHELNGEALAKAMGISPGAARVRLHRALNHLRDSQIAREWKNRHD